jgi:hypothetical protein
VLKTFDVEGPVEMEIRLASGDIAIDPSLDGQVEVELTAYDEESRQLIEHTRVELTGTHLIVEVPQKRGFSFGLVFGRSGIGCRIRCPQDSGVSARTKSADVEARGTIGGLNVQTASGDTVADRVTGGVNVKAASGDIRVNWIGAGLNANTASGDITIGTSRGPLNVSTASGDVEVDAAYDNVHANTVSGDQQHRAVMVGNVSAHSVSGDVTIGVRRGSKVYLDCNTVSGDTSSELDMTGDVPAGDGPLVEVRAKTVSGDIRITRAPAPSDTAVSTTEEVQA